MKGKKYLNKWNGREYALVSDEGNAVSLERDDGMTFTIQKSELAFSYCEKTLKKVSENA